MNSHIQESIEQIIAAHNAYVMGVHEYNNFAQQHITEWAEQRGVYEAWCNVNEAYVGYLAGVSELTQSLTTDAFVPVPALSIVGIGILGVGVIYVNSGAGIMVGAATHPFYESASPEHNETGYVMAVGGLPDGTIIYTTLGTYSIQGGQPINLMVG